MIRAVSSNRPPGEDFWGGTYTLVYDIKERLENLGVEPHFLPFSLMRDAPPPRLETALDIIDKILLQLGLFY
mgnify:CR=1 FL=1